MLIPYKNIFTIAHRAVDDIRKKDDQTEKFRERPNFRMKLWTIMYGNISSLYNMIRNKLLLLKISIIFTISLYSSALGPTLLNTGSSPFSAVCLSKASFCALHIFESRQPLADPWKHTECSKIYTKSVLHLVFRKSILKQMQYRFAFHFGTLGRYIHGLYLPRHTPGCGEMG